ncbi:MAG: hypothetical protein OEM63_13235, partial [Gammaproteobacteria bacterium]|nr:hypothetical protein [Gammaproteobacteria bacterium]
ERSNELFPTAIATFSLGNLEAKRGNKEKAIEYYTAVAGSQGEIAEAAKVALVRLDLEENPGKYLRYGCYADNRGDLVVAIANSTPVAVRDVRFAVQVRDSYGNVRTIEESIRGPIAAGQRGDRSTGVGPYTESAGCPVQLTSAKVAE